MLEILLYAALIGVASSIYRNVLLYEDIFKWWVKIGQKHKDKIYFKPIWGCDKCIAGQLTMWLLVLNAVHGLNIKPLSYLIELVMPIVQTKNISFLTALISISISVLVAMITTKLIKRI